MCGLVAGFTFSEEINRNTVDLMTDSMAHRGPDGRGIFIDDKNRFFFGHSLNNDRSDSASQLISSNDCCSNI